MPLETINLDTSNFSNDQSKVYAITMWLEEVGLYFAVEKTGDKLTAKIVP